jgi:hypothetical protein
MYEYKRQTRAAIHVDAQGYHCDAEIVLTLDIKPTDRKVYVSKCPKCMGWIEFDFREAL